MEPSRQALVSAKGNLPLKREALNHTKMKRLCRRLDIPQYAGVGIMESIWQLCAAQSPRGDIGKLTDEDIALAIDWRGDEQPLIEALLHCGWLEKHTTHRLIVHDWPEHCPDSVHVSLARTIQCFVRANGEFVRPKLSKIRSEDRAGIDEAFKKRFAEQNARAQNPDLCAQNDQKQWKPSTQPSPSPQPTTTEEGTIQPSVSNSNSENVGLMDSSSDQLFPPVAVAVRVYYPETADPMILQLVNAVLASAATINGHAKRELTGDLIAEAVHQCKASSPKQFSAGLFLKNVPTYVKHRLQQEGDVPEPAKGKKSLSERTTDLMKKRIARGERPV